MSFALIPGWGLLVILSLIANYFSEIVTLGGKHPLEASALVVVLGIIIRNSLTIPAAFSAGLKASERLLIFGIVLMGASLDYSTILSQGGPILAVLLVTMSVGFFSIFLLGRAFKLPLNLAVLLSVGTTICGGTAVAVTAPLIKAKEEETSYAVGVIALWGIAAILVYPAVARMFGTSDFVFGVFAGTAIHSTPQVVGAGFIFSDLAGKTATAVKLIRNCFMAPIAFILAAWHAKKSMQQTKDASRVDFLRAFPWFLFVYFIMSWLSTNGYFSAKGIDNFTAAGKFFILLGMAGVGLNTDLRAFKSIGFKPFFVGFLGAVVVALCSIVMIKVSL